MTTSTLLYCLTSEQLNRAIANSGDTTIVHHPMLHSVQRDRAGDPVSAVYSAFRLDGTPRMQPRRDPAVKVTVTFDDDRMCYVGVVRDVEEFKSRLLAA